MIFSVADYSVWELFPWEKFVLLYGAAFFFFLLPKPQLVWPLSKFGLFRGAARQPGVAAICCVSVLVVSHFLVIFIPLKPTKHRISSGMEGRVFIQVRLRALKAHSSPQLR